MSITDKQIAYAWLNDLLRNALPSHDGLRARVDIKLNDRRCEKITARIAAETERVRARYVDYLKKAGHDA